MNKHKYGLCLQWCLFFTGCPFLVATGHKSCCCDGTLVFHPIEMGVYQNLIRFWILCGSVIWGKYVSIIWAYIGQEVRKCNSVSTSFYGQCAHSLSSWEPCLPTVAFLSSKTMFTESVHSQSFPSFCVSHSGLSLCFSFWISFRGFLADTPTCLHIYGYALLPWHPPSI
jgi:hypothetical protein